MKGHPKAPLKGNKRVFLVYAATLSSAINKFHKKHKNYVFEELTG